MRQKKHTGLVIAIALIGGFVAYEWYKGQKAAATLPTLPVIPPAATLVPVQSPVPSLPITQPAAVVVNPPYTSQPVASTRISARMTNVDLVSALNHLNSLNKI